MTDTSIEVLSQLRDPNTFQWYVIPLFVIVAYIYLNEIEKRNWSAVWLGIAMWAFELIWEMTNGLILHFSHYAALWSIPGHTAYLIYVGLNIEITLFFAVGGLLLIKALPKDKDIKIAGIPNRIIIPAAGSAAAVIGEFALNRMGILGWDWWFWGSPHLYIIFINYFGPSYCLVWMHDNLTTRQKRMTARILLILAAICHIVFATILGWV